MNTTLAMGPDVMVFALWVVGPVVALYGLFQLVSDLRSAPRKKIADRLKARSARIDADKSVKENLRKQGPTVDGALASTIHRFQITERLQQILDQANVNISAPQLLVNLTLVASVVMAIIVAFGLNIIAAIGAAAGMYILPLLYFAHLRKKRLARLVQQLPDVFELLSQALRAGHSLASGMQLVANELPDPAGTEFGRVFHEQNLGLKVEDALRNLADRMDVLDVRFFVTAVLIQRQTGGDLAEVLDKISGVIRERIKLHGTVQALTAEGRLSGYVLLALPILVFGAMLKINNDYAMVLLTHPTGQMMAVCAAVMMVMGWAMIKKIINVDV